MPAGTVRAQVKVSLSTPYGTSVLPVDFAASADEAIPPVTVEVANAVTDQSLIVIGAAGGIETIQAIAIVADVAISVKLGVAGSNVAFPLAAGAPFVLMGTSLTAVSISNNSGGVALVTYACAGT